MSWLHARRSRPESCDPGSGKRAVLHFGVIERLTCRAAGSALAELLACIYCSTTLPGIVDVFARVFMSLVISRMDYCNSVLVGLPASTLAPLQRAQNAAARLILGLSRRSHITRALQQLHWLPF